MIFINDKRDEDIYNMLEVSIKNKNIEFELLYGKKRVNQKIISTITKEDFHKHLNHYKYNPRILVQMYYHIHRHY